MKKAMIFGIDGQDGSYLADLLLSKDYQVIGWVPEAIPVSYENINHIIDEIEIVEGSLIDQEGVNSLLRNYLPEEVYNLASPSSPPASWENVVYKSDVVALGVARLLEAIRTNIPSSRFYQASSSELFGDPLEEPQNENTPFHPRNPYGISKLFAHWLTVNYRNKYDLFTVSGIMYNHESPRRGLQYVTRKITNSAAKIKLGLSDKLRLGNLEARRDWGYAGDYVKAMWLMLQQDHPIDYVIGTGKTHSVREFCDLAFSHLGLDYREHITVDDAYFRPNENKRLVADCKKANNELNWQPETSFKELVKTMVDEDYRSLKSLSKD
ncbi:MAG: GDP-mannose 4,6-dehydratase [Anaerolineales bacterium]